MSNYQNSHLYCNNNIYKIVLSMEDTIENIPPAKDDEDKYNK